MTKRFGASKKVKASDRSESPPSAISKFFTAIFTCGVAKDNDKGCCTGKPKGGPDDKENIGLLSPQLFRPLHP